MNLYKLYSDAKSLKHHDTAPKRVPKLVWHEYDLDRLSKHDMLDPEIRTAFAKDAELAVHYALYILDGKRFTEAEDEIAKDTKASYDYAVEVLKGPFKKGEATIARNPAYAVNYAADVVKGKFPLGEPLIANDAYWLTQYAVKALKRRFPAGENKILANYRYDNIYKKEFRIED